MTDYKSVCWITYSFIYVFLIGPELFWTMGRLLLPEFASQQVQTRAVCSDLRLQGDANMSKVTLSLEMMQDNVGWAFQAVCKIPVAVNICLGSTCGSSARTPLLEWPNRTLVTGVVCHTGSGLACGNTSWHCSWYGVDTCDAWSHGFKMCADAVKTVPYECFVSPEQPSLGVFEEVPGFSGSFWPRLICFLATGLAMVSGSISLRQVLRKHKLCRAICGGCITMALGMIMIGLHQRMLNLQDLSMSKTVDDARRDREQYPLPSPEFWTLTDTILCFGTLILVGLVIFVICRYDELIFGWITGNRGHCRNYIRVDIEEATA